MRQKGSLFLTDVVIGDFEFDHVRSGDLLTNEGMRKHLEAYW